jgi:ankyrin repeat protein
MLLSVILLGGQACWSTGEKSLDLELLNAVEFLDFFRVDEAIKNGADVNYKDKGTPVLLISFGVYERNKEIISLLIASGADVNARGVGGRTALMVALMLDAYYDQDMVNTIGQLINAGADVNAFNDVGQSALSIAQQYLKIQVARDEDGQRRMRAIIDLLVAAGAHS